MDTNTRERVSMKGTPRTVITNGNLVEVWLSSPTGDSSDSHILTIPCLNHAQASVLAETWVRVWGLNA